MSEGYERISWDQAKAWWSHRPAFKAGQIRDPGATESFFAVSKAGGRKADPAKEYSELHAYYTFGNATVETSNIYQIVDSGGLVIQVYHYPGTASGYGNSRARAFFKDVTVRGHAAKSFEDTRESGDNIDRRIITWFVVKDGNTIEWVVTTHPTKYTEAESIAFIDSFIEA